MKITYYGHACFAVETVGKTLLFDPFITPNELAKSVRFDTIRADAILVTHGHFDHIADVAALAQSTGAMLVANYEIVQWFGKQGLENAHPMNLGGAHAFDFGRVKLVPAIHSSGFPDGKYAGTAGGFVIENAEGAFYYSGDTALTLDMQLIGEEFDLAFAALPIGDNFTMGPADAAKAAKFVGAPKVLGLHYDTFPPIRIDHAKALATFADLGVELLLPGIGESFEILAPAE